MKKTLNFLLVVAFAVFSISQVSAQTQNYLTSSGNQLFDVNGDEVRLTGINWFGFETSLFFPHGIWKRDMKSVLQQIKDLGFNTIRVPWCNEMLDPEATISVPSYGVDAYSGITPMNEMETNVTKPIELLDIFVDWCQENDMKIVLDNHSRSADGFLVEGLWYTDEYSEERWINDWIFMAERYAGLSAVVAMDLNNEPHGSSWGNSTPATDWNKAAERCGNAILEVNPDVIIIVEGVGSFEGNSYWWGGNLMGAEQYPITLSNPSKLMYSAHEYGPEVSPQDWFDEASFPNNMSEIWGDNYDYLYENNTSPIFVGEFGIKNQEAFNGVSYTWFTEFMDFMGGRYSWTFWTMNPNSGDTGGILQDDWVSINQWKMDVLSPYFSALIPNVIGGVVENKAPEANFISFNEPCGENARIVFLDASLSSDPDGDNLTYSWSFGDGNTSSGKIITYEYAVSTQEDFIINLTVSDGALEDTTSQLVNVTVGACAQTEIESLTIETSTLEGEAPLSVDFEGITTMFDGEVGAVDFSWDFDGNGSGFGQSITSVFNEPGVYNVSLTAEASVNTVAETVTITVNAPIDINNELSLNYKNAGSDPTDSSINPHIEILNNGTSAVAYSDLSIRYWFTSEDSDSLTFWCDWAQLGTANILGNFGTTNGMNFLEITFANATGNLNANSNSGAIQSRFAKTNWSAFNENDDYSYDSSITTFTSYDRITLYKNGSLVWGVEPNNSSAKSLTNSSPILFNMFPNPTTDSVTIENSVSFENADIIISNLTGQTIKTMSINNSTDKTFNVDTTDLNAGIYVITVASETRTLSKMLIIK